MKNKWYTMRKKGKTGELRIFDEIGFWGISADDFFNDLDALGDVDDIHLRLNSPGGVITDGNAIYNVLKRHKANVKVTIEGIAASMASVIAMAGDEVVMPENAFLMIHNPHVFMGGGADDLRHEADLLDKMKKSAIKAYKRKATISNDDISKMMDDETWITAEEAVKMGFADIVEESIEEPEKEEAKLDKHNFNCIPTAAMCYFRAEKASSDESGENGNGESETTEKENEPDKKPDNIDENENPSTEGDTEMDYKQIAQMVLTASGKINKEIERFVSMAEPKIGAEKAKSLLAELKSPINGKLNDITNIENMGAEVEGIIRDAKNSVADAVLVGGVIPPAENIQIGKEDQEKFVEAATVAFMHSARLPVDEKQTESVRKAGMLGMGPLGYCREILARNHVRGAASMAPVRVYDELKGLPKMAFSQGSGDFANAFEDVANKSLQDAWANAPVTYQGWTGRDTIPDFRQKNVVRITETGDVAEVLEDEGFSFTSTNDSKEVATLITVGVAFGLTRKAIINDDLNALTDIPSKLGRSVQRYINRQAYTTLYGSAMLGPTMNEDSVAMFNAASHVNYVATGSGAVPSATTISTLNRYMRNQKVPTPDQDQSSSIYTNATPKAILYHSSLDMTIEGLMSPKYLVTGTANAVVTRDFITKLVGISDPVLDELMDANSHAGYYLIADPRDVGLINVYFLRGQESPTMRRKVSDVAEPLGTTWDIYLDVTVGAVDFRGGAANFGE